MYELLIQENSAGQRLDKVLKKHLKEAPDSFIYKMLRKKNITLNHKKAEGKEKTNPGDRIQIFFSEETYEKMRGVPAHSGLSPIPSSFPEIQILYEDQDVLIFVKPAGVLSQKSYPSSFSANDWVLRHVQEKGLVSGSEFEICKPAVTNRLDQNTGGIMAAGLSIRGLKTLSELFRNRTLSKNYYALVVGRVEKPETLQSYLIKDERHNEVRIYRNEVPGGKMIRTEYEPIQYDPENDLTLLNVHLLTGRSHQIRAHLASVGHPILGDQKYGIPQINLKYHKTQQCLLAYRLEFPECELQSISRRIFELPVPEDWPVSLE